MTGNPILRAVAILRIVRQRPFRARYTRNSRLDHGLFGADFIAHDPDGFRTGANENKTGFFDAFSEVGIF